MDVVLDAEQAADPTPPVISVVVPTRNEAGNVKELVRRLDSVSSQIPLEVIFVDDSTDDTPDVIQRLQADGRDDVILIHRPLEQRVDGLGGAVLRGLQAARAPWTCVMDADLQHPPELLPRLLAEAERSGSDLVVASRYRDDGESNSFGLSRALISRGSTVAAKAIFPDRLRSVTDPMSGYFMVRSAAVDTSVLRPSGFKILLEIIGRTKGLRISEVPFQFGTRFAGESKASLTEGLRLTETVLRLRFGDSAGRFVQFGMVGVSGLVVNTAVLAFAGEVLGLFYLLAAVLATQVSTGWNFVISERLVFDGENQRFGRLQRATMFYAMNNAALALRGPMIFVLTEAVALNYLVSNVVSLTVLMVLRFFTADRWIWGSEATPETAYSPAIAPAASAAGEGA